MKDFLGNELKIGDIVVILWRNYCRRARVNDVRLLGFSCESVKKGKYLTKITDKAYYTIDEKKWSKVVGSIGDNSK